MPGEQERPVAERVQPRERDVARADHQRDQVVEERRRQRHHDEEHHRDAVHREELVVDRRRTRRSGPAARAAARISSASLPPTRKNTKAVTPYRIPIFLWSTVVIQLQKPVVACGRRSSPPGPASAGTLTLAIGSSVTSGSPGTRRAASICVGRQAVVGHPRARLDRRAGSSSHVARFSSVVVAAMQPAKHSRLAKCVRFGPPLRRAGCRSRPRALRPHGTRCTGRSGTPPCRSPRPTPAAA